MDVSLCILHVMLGPDGEEDLDRWEKLAKFWRENYQATGDERHLWLAERFDQLCADAAAKADEGLRVVMERKAWLDIATGKEAAKIQRRMKRKSRAASR